MPRWDSFCVGDDREKTKKADEKGAEVDQEFPSLEIFVQSFQIVHMILTR